MIKKILIGFVSLVGLFAIIIIVVAIVSIPTSSPTPPLPPAVPPPVVVSEPPPVPPPAPVSEPAPQVEPIPETKPVTFEPIIITGTGDKTSPPFTVTTGEWVIDWSYTPTDPEYAVFGLFVYPRGETAVFVESVLFPESTSGTTYSYAGPGEYYIKVSSGNIEQWEIVIKPAP